MNFKVNPRIFENFPDLAIGVVVATGIDNSGAPAKVEEILQSAVGQARESWSDDRIAEDPGLVAWKEAYRSFGAKPKKYKCSIESLYRMILGGGELSSINPVVDIYNATSLRYGVPVGGDDLDQVSGSIELTLAEGTEHFIPLNASDSMSPKAGEVVYRDDAEVLCRRWNWRECDKTKMTDKSTNVCLVVEGLPPVSAGQVQEVVKDLAETVQQLCGGTVKTHLVEKGAPEVVLL